MKHIFKILFLFLPALSYSQGGTWPVKYNDSDPSGAPSAAGTRLHFNTATNTLWFWEPAPSSTWRKQPKAFDQISGCAAPAYTPTARQSTFAVNSCSPVPELYQYTGSAWVLLNPGGTYTAGTGISIASGVISNTGDLSTTNELNTSLSVTGGNLRLTDAGGNLDVAVSSIAPVQAVVAGTGISVSGTTTRTITNTAPDQTVAISAGTGIGVSGTYPNFTVTNSAPADGNGIYSGSGSVVGEVDVTVENVLAFRFASGNSALKFDNGETSTYFSSDDEGSTMSIGNAGFIISTPGNGLVYTAYYPDIETSPQSVTDVQTVQSIVGKKAFNGNYTATGTATTAFTVTLPTTQPDATYSVSIMPKNALSATGWYISARTTTTFTVTYLTGLTGAVDFDYIIVN